MTAIRTCAGIQVPGRSMPSLLPEGLERAAHLSVALKTIHPMARPPVVPAHVAFAFDSQPSVPAVLVDRRRRVHSILDELAILCAVESVTVASACHPFLKAVVTPRNVCFMREISFVVGQVDPLLWVDYAFGLPMLGWARHSSTMVQRESRPPRVVSASPSEIEAGNRAALAKARSTGDDDLDRMAWEKTSKELENGTMYGPYYSLDALPPGAPRLLNRFPILEKHGGATEASCRVIDDCKISSHNIDSGNTAAHRPADLDLWAAMTRYAVARFRDDKQRGFPSDFKGAYRQVTACPWQAIDFVVASWDPILAQKVFFLAVSQLFGSGNSPLNFSRVPDWCCRVLAFLFAIGAIHCVDDVLVFERLATVDSAYSAWRGFALLCGWDVPDAKSPPPADFFRVLGAMVDLRLYPEGPILLRAAHDRVEALVEQLEDIRTSGRLPPALAGKIYGKLMFMSSQFFGRLGRALLRAFSRRQHEPERFALNPQIRFAIQFWISNMATLRPREIPIDFSSMPTYVSYSDGEGDTAGIGIALWFPDGSSIGGYIQLPEAVRNLWSRRNCGAEEHFDIFEIEALGPALILSNWGHLMRPGLWVHYIDNDAALATLVKGSSSVMSGECISAYTHTLISEHSLWPWFDRVDSAANPVDKLSRGEMNGPWKLLPIVFPDLLLQSISSFLDSPT